MAERSSGAGFVPPSPSDTAGVVATVMSQSGGAAFRILASPSFLSAQFLDVAARSTTKRWRRSDVGCRISDTLALAFCLWPLDSVFSGQTHALTHVRHRVLCDRRCVLRSGIK